MTLADFTWPGLIVPRLCGRDAPGVIHELSLVLHREGVVPDLLPFYNTALNREFLLSTDLESGLACPHARLPGVKTPAFSFGRSDEPFVWSPQFTHPVRLVFLLAVPATEPVPYLAMLSGVAQLAKDSRLLDSIRGAVDTGSILEVFSRITLHGRRPSEPAASPAMPGVP
jgi:mannitol/fructose-specific phosphotransferase system IIA component (Ntr-type)